MKLEIVHKTVDNTNKNKTNTKEKKKKLEFSKKLTLIFMFLTTLVTLVTLFLCYKCIVLNYGGSLPFLSALIGLQEVSLGYICGEYMKKSKAENTTGGIVYENSLINTNANTSSTIDSTGFSDCI